MRKDDIRYRVTRVISTTNTEGWSDCQDAADEIIGVFMDARAEDEAWKLAQIAAAMFGGSVKIGKSVAIEAARSLLAEARRQTADSPHAG